MTERINEFAVTGRRIKELVDGKTTLIERRRNGSNNIIRGIESSIDTALNAVDQLLRLPVGRAVGPNGVEKGLDEGVIRTVGSLPAIGVVFTVQNELQATKATILT